MEPTTARDANEALEPAPGTGSGAAWPLALALSVALGLLFRLTMWNSWGRGFLPGYVWAPASGVAILLYLALAGRRARPGGPAGDAAPEPAQVAWAALVLMGFSATALAFSPERDGALSVLAFLHLPVVTWLVMAVALLGRARDPLERFAAAVKTIEVLVTGAIYAGVAAVFVAVTIGLLSALQVDVPEAAIHGAFAFLLGLVPVLAVASAYDPARLPSAQRFGAGVTRVFLVVARLFLAPTLLVLLVVAVILPARFAVLAENRATLAVFNAMLFAVMVLIVGATPLRAGDLAPAAAAWLRRGIAAVALLAAVVGAFALAAVLSRTAQGGLTPNRLTVIGWNVVNLLALLLLLLRQPRAGRDGWVRALHLTFGEGLALYALWSAFVLLALPHVARLARWPLTAPTGLPG